MLFFFKRLIIKSIVKRFGVKKGKYCGVLILLKKIFEKYFENSKKSLPL
jgi:hypothetical protein